MLSDGDESGDGSVSSHRSSVCFSMSVGIAVCSEADSGIECGRPSSPNNDNKFRNDESVLEELGGKVPKISSGIESVSQASFVWCAGS